MSRRDQDRWDKPKRQRTQRFAPAEPMQGWDEEPRRPKRRRDEDRPRALVPVREEPRERGGFAGLARPAKLGENSVIATKHGMRAAVIPLQKGLYLVAELPNQATKSEFGIAPLLAPMMVKAAVRALTGDGDRGDRGDGPRLLERLRPERKASQSEDGPRLLERLRPERRAPQSEDELIEEVEALLGVAPDDFGCAKCGGGCGGRRP
jgi:hypothetical protein